MTSRHPISDSASVTHRVLRAGGAALLALLPVALLSSCATVHLPRASDASAVRAASSVMPSPSATLGRVAPAPIAPSAPSAPTGPAADTTVATLAAPRGEVDKASALRTWVEQQSRIYRVAAPLLVNNTELCPKHARQVLGFTAKNRYSYSDAFTDAAASALGLGDDLQIMTVLPGSGAEQAGLRQGDVLLAVEIEPIPRGPDAERAAAELIGSEMRGRTSLHLVVRRDGQRTGIDVPLTRACAMAIDLGNAVEPVGFADDQRVMITRGMLDFVQSDAELAYVLAREIARNETMTEDGADVRDIIDRLHTVDAAPVGLAAALGTAVRTYATHVDGDTEKLTLSMLARAGVDIGGYQAFWQRLAVRAAEDVSGRTATVQPPDTMRLSTLDQATRDVASRNAGGIPSAP